MILSFLTLTNSLTSIKNEHKRPHVKIIAIHIGISRPKNCQSNLEHVPVGENTHGTKLSSGKKSGKLAFSGQDCPNFGKYTSCIC